MIVPQFMEKIDDLVLLLVFFFFNDTATTEIYTLSLHDALPISVQKGLPTPRQCSAAASMASSASVASCPCPPQKCLLFSRITTQPLAESHDRSFRPPVKALQSALSLSGKRSARDTSARKSSLSCAWWMST